MTAKETNLATVRKLYEACINTGRLELLRDLVSEDYVGPNGETGVAGFEATIADLRAAFPDIRYTLEDSFGDDDHVAVRWTWQGTHRGAFRGFPPTNKTATNAAIGIYELKGGRIVRAWLQTDRLGFLQQMGVVPPLNALASRAGPARGGDETTSTGTPLGTTGDG